MKKYYILIVSVLVTSISYGQIFITEIADPSNNTSCRYIELYNAGGSSVDLGAGNYILERYTTSNTPYTTETLTGTITAGGFYIIGVEDDFNTCYGFTPDQVLNSSSFFSNGDDQITLVDGSDTVLDIFGVIEEDGTDTCHDFEDGRAERKAAVTGGNSGTWDESEWNVTGDSVVAGCTSHSNGTIATTDDVFDPGAWIGAPVTDTVVEFVSATSSISENTASIDICVSIANPNGGIATTVELNLDGSSTTTNGSDYSNIIFPKSLIFPAGSSTNQCYTITISNDATLEFDETLILNLQNPTGGASAGLGVLTQYTLTILANDLDVPSPGDIIITEIMQNPSVTSDEDGEFFEVYNKTGNAIDMNGWVIQDHNSSATISNINGTTIVPAGGYLVFATNTNSAQNGNITQANYNLQGSDIILANSNGRIILTAETIEIDRVEWNGSGSDGFPVPNGASMELATDKFDEILNDTGSNWGLSVSSYGDGDFGSPGAENGYSLSIVNNEIDGFTMYPNPISDGFFSINTLSKRNKLIHIYDVFGKQVYNKSIKNKEQINVSKLISGVYILIVNEEGKIATRKLIIN